jgi:hypothetical protein
MKSFQWSLLAVVVLMLVSSVSGALPWDKNTTSLHHFDRINMDGLTMGTIPNHTLDQSSLYWYPFTSPDYVTSGCKFGQCIRFSDPTAAYMLMVDENQNTTVTNLNFGKEGNWTVEGWVNLTSAPAATLNATLVSWMGYGDYTLETVNGTHIYINSARMIGVTTPSTITGTPLIISTTALTLNTWNSFAVVKNGSSLKLFVNGKQNATSSTANSYSWSPPDNTAMFSSIGYGMQNPFSSQSPSGLMDEVRISNVSRYGGNYTPQTVEFLNPLNKTTTFHEAPSSTYNVGETAIVSNYISNTSYITQFATQNECLTSDCSNVQQLGVSLPSGWTMANNGSNSVQYTIPASSVISSKTLIGQSLVSFDQPGFFSTGSVEGAYGDYFESKFWLSNNPGYALYNINNDFLSASYNAEGTVTDLSASSSEIYANDDTYTSYPNIGQKINVTLFGAFLYDTSGVTGSVTFNKSIWHASNVYNHQDTPYYDIKYTIDNNLGFVNFTAVYPAYGGITADPTACPVGSPTDCGIENYLNIEFYPVVTAIGYPAGSAYIYIANPNTKYTAGNPFLNDAGYTYSNEYAYYDSYSPLGFTDNSMLTHIRLIDINSNQPIDGAASVSYDARSVSPASPQNIVGGLFDITHKGGTFNITATADGYFASTQTFTVGEDGTTIDLILTPFSGPNAQMQFYPKYTTFHVKEGWGLATAGVEVTMTPISTSMGDWDWIGTLLGIPIGEIPLDTAALHQTTDSYGTATFYVVPTEKYNVTFTKTGYTIPPMIVVPKEDDYYVWASSIESTFYEHGYNELEQVNVTILQTPVNDTATTVSVTYYDALSHTTGGTIDILRDNATPGGNRVILGSFPVVSSSFTNTTVISHPNGMSGVVNVNATHTDFGQVKRTYTFSYKGFTVQLLGLSADVILMVALGLIFLTAMSGGILVGRPIAIVACFEMWIFYAWGWFQPMILRGMATDVSLVLAMTLATVIAIAANMEIRKKKEKY